MSGQIVARIQPALFWEGNHFSSEINSTCGTASTSVSQLRYTHLFLYIGTGDFDKRQKFSTTCSGGLQMAVLVQLVELDSTLACFAPLVEFTAASKYCFPPLNLELPLGFEFSKAYRKAF